MEGVSGTSPLSLPRPLEVSTMQHPDQFPVPTTAGDLAHRGVSPREDLLNALARRETYATAAKLGGCTERDVRRLLADPVFITEVAQRRVYGIRGADWLPFFHDRVIASMRERDPETDLFVPPAPEIDDWLARQVGVIQRQLDADADRDGPPPARYL
jgi:hypothetical protein